MNNQSLSPAEISDLITLGLIGGRGAPGNDSWKELPRIRTVEAHTSFVASIVSNTLAENELLNRSSIIYALHATLQEVHFGSLPIAELNTEQNGILWGALCGVSVPLEEVNQLGLSIKNLRRVIFRGAGATFINDFCTRFKQHLLANGYDGNAVREIFAQAGLEDINSQYTPQRAMIYPDLNQDNTSTRRSNDNYSGFDFRDFVCRAWQCDDELCTDSMKFGAKLATGGMLFTVVFVSGLACCLKS